MPKLLVYFNQFFPLHEVTTLGVVAVAIKQQTVMRVEA